MAKIIIPETRNDGAIKINGTLQNNVVAKPSLLLAPDVEQRINLPYPAFPLALDSFPTTSWPPNNTVRTDQSIVENNSGVTSFYENGVLGQVHYWRVAFTYSGKNSGNDATVKCRIFNEYNGSTFNLTSFSQTGSGATTTSGSLLFNFISIADTLSLPAPLSNGHGYSFAIISSNSMTVTFNHLTRISQQYVPRSI